MKLTPEEKLDIEGLLEDLEHYRPRRSGWTWREHVPDQVLGPFVYRDTSVPLERSIPLPAAHDFGDVDPQDDLVITTEDVLGDRRRISTSYAELGEDVRPGDRILAIDGQEIGSWEQMAGVIHSKAEVPLTLSVERGEGPFTVEVTPRKDPEGDRGLIGIAPGPHGELDHTIRVGAEIRQPRRNESSWRH